MSYLLRTLGFSFAVATSMLFLVAQLKAEIYPPNCAGANASELELYVNIGGPVHVNEIIEYQVILVNPQLTIEAKQNCRITNASASIRLPNGLQFVVFTNIALNPGQS